VLGRISWSAIFAGALSLQAAAQMDSASQNLLIEKLDGVYLHLPANDPSKVAVTLRLADLYADRARQASVSGGADRPLDRQKALRLYGEVVDQASDGARPKIILQMGHLHQMNGDEDKAIGFYTKNISSQLDPALLSEANLALGEIYFKRRDFNKAIPYYDEVLKHSQAGSRGLAVYRRAWSYFHKGEITTAIQELERILKSTELQARSGASTGVDPQFKEEVARDLATFMAKDPVTLARVETLFALSPEHTRVQNGYALAHELERLSKRQEALLTWNFVVGHLAQPSERLVAQLSMAQLHLDTADKASALKNYERALQSWGDAGVKGTEGEAELKRRARNFVVAWNQTEKKQPTPELLTAYELYLSVFSDDIDARLYAAQLATDLKNYPAAWTHFTHARDLLAKEPGQADKLESVLLSMIETGESAKNETLEMDSYASYIQYSAKKTKLSEVRYQQAHALYDKGDYAKASEALRALAVEVKADAKLRKQAADLSLDALVLLKDELHLITWAKEYEMLFTDQAAEFSAIIQKAVLTRAAALAEKDPAAALAALKDFNPLRASGEDKLKYYKNTLILAEKLAQIKEASMAADALLSLPSVSMEDRELAWSRKAYFAELRLDFSTAFAATEKLEKTFPVDEKNFKLAVFAELSGRASSPFYLNYLAKSKDEDRKPLVAAELVRKAKNPEAELEKVKGVLAAHPALLAELYAEIYSATAKEAVLRKVASNSALNSTEAGRLLARQKFLKEFAPVKAKLSADKMDSSGNAKLAASIKRRGVLLTKAEDLAKRSIQSGDWTAQLISIDLIARESERFYQDLLSAPVPAGLNSEEEQEYLNLLSAQAMPFQTKAAEAKAKVAQFWSTSDWSAPLAASWQRKSLRGLLDTEIAALKEVAPPEQLSKFDAFMNAREPQLAMRPSVSELQLARQKVYENPMDRKALEDLLTLERSCENRAMSEYLATRLERLTKGTL
jgi:hypothetical protein